MGLALTSSRSADRGFTLVETMVTMSVFLIVMALGFNFFTRSQRLVKLAENEAKMQMYARQAMTIITKEIRQATDYKDVEYKDQDPNQPAAAHAIKILIVRPNANNSSEYTLVTYWYEKNNQGVYSLYRAEKPNNLSDKIKSTDIPDINGNGGFSPSYSNSTDRKDYKIKPLIREATAVDPGNRSYFQQEPEPNKSRIKVQLITAVYGVQKGANTTGQLEVKRQFQLDTSIHARNLN